MGEDAPHVGKVEDVGDNQDRGEVVDHHGGLGQLENLLHLVSLKSRSCELNSLDHVPDVEAGTCNRVKDKQDGQAQFAKNSSQEFVVDVKMYKHERSSWDPIETGKDGNACVLTMEEEESHEGEGHNGRDDGENYFKYCCSNLLP